MPRSVRTAKLLHEVSSQNEKQNEQECLEALCRALSIMYDMPLIMSLMLLILILSYPSNIKVNNTE